MDKSVHLSIVSLMIVGIFISGMTAFERTVVAKDLARFESAFDAGKAALDPPNLARFESAFDAKMYPQGKPVVTEYQFSKEDDKLWNALEYVENRREVYDSIQRKPKGNEDR